jgi:glycerol-3-phosphate dehydrogenase subunit B
MLDLIVIGAGLTGLMAACTAAQAGLKVKIVSKGLGALHWSAGTIDVLGYAGAQSPVERPLQAIQALVNAQPQHPYALLDGAGLKDALQAFAALSKDSGLPYWGSGDVNLLLPSPVGAARPTFLAPQAQLTGDLSRPEPMLIVGFRGMRDFFPELIAANLNKLPNSTLDTRHSTFARAAFLPLDLITDRHDSNTVQLASGLDDSARCKGLAAELKKLVQPRERIGLPAILGVAQHAAVMKELQAATGAAVFEIPTLPPSVPGFRLMAALRRKVEALGVRVDVNMEVKGFHAENGRIAWIETDASARPLKHRADKFLLATGGILGGGLNSDHTGRVWEVCFDLPLDAPGNRREWFRARFFDLAGHPIFSTGVRVNRQFQPVDASGAPAYANLWAAGGILAHADPIRERSLEGIAMATGRAAAQQLITNH